MHYKHRYHLRFEHARKLFLFDMILVFSTVAIAGAGLFWRWYDPTITDLIELSVVPVSSETGTPIDRVKSGEYLTYQATFTNNSDILMTNTALTFSMPNGFVFVTSTLPRSDSEVSTTHPTNILFDLPPLRPSESGSLSITGYFYGTPDTDEHVITTLTYQQEGKDVWEQKIARTITTLRGSVIELRASLPHNILNRGTVPLIISITNTGNHPVNTISLPLTLPAGFHFSFTSSTKGDVQDNSWNIDLLSPQETVDISGTVTFDIPSNQATQLITFVSQLLVNGYRFSQVPVTHTFTVVSPQATIEWNWPDGSGLKPGNTYPVTLIIENTGNTTLEQLQVTLPLPAGIVSASAFANMNNIPVSGTTARITAAQFASLKQLRAGESAAITFELPIRAWPSGGTNLLLTLSPTLEATVPEVTDQQYRTTMTSNNISIGTALSVQTSARYYTKEGDQLGRGPLPPRVGKETKYWALITVSNNTSNVSPLSISATLPAGVSWTGRSSVSHGKDVTYSANSRKIHWSLHALSAHDTAQIGFELAITPTSGQLGTTPLLLSNIQVQGTDTFIDELLTLPAPALDSSLLGDSLAEAKGTKVAE